MYHDMGLGLQEWRCISLFALPLVQIHFFSSVLWYLGYGLSKEVVFAWIWLAVTILTLKHKYTDFIR